MLLLMFTLSSSVFGQTLWQDLTAGMTEGEAHRLHPEKEVAVFSENFDLHLRFGKDGKQGLRSVALRGKRHTGPLAGEETRDLLSKISAALTLKHGPKVTEEHDSMIHEYTWRTKESVLIVVSIMGPSQFLTSSQLNVTYTLEADVSTEKL